MRFCLSLPSGKGSGESLSVIPGTAADAGGDTAPVSLKTVPLDILVPVVWCPMHTEARVTSCWGSKLEGDTPPTPAARAVQPLGCFCVDAPWWQWAVIIVQFPDPVHLGQAAEAGRAGWFCLGRLEKGSQRKGDS